MFGYEICTYNELYEKYEINDQIMQELTDKIRLWLKQQIHLPQDISDSQIKNIIYFSQLDLEKTKKRLDAHYTLRNLVPEIYSNYDQFLDNTNHLRQQMKFAMLPKLTPRKVRVAILQTVDTDAEFEFWNHVKYIFMGTDLVQHEDIANSYIIIIDCTYLRLRHVLKITPSMLNKLNACMESYGERTEAVYFINVARYVERLVELFKAIINIKLVGTIKAYTSGMESLYEIIPKSILPEDYGGEEASMAVLDDLMYTNLIKRRDWFLKREKMVADESLRTNSVINPNDLFGVHGSFRKLDID